MSPNQIKILELQAAAWKRLNAAIKANLYPSEADALANMIAVEQAKIQAAMEQIPWKVSIVPSRSKGPAHTVRSDGEGWYVCDCKAAEFDKECHAIQKVRLSDFVKAR